MTTESTSTTTPTKRRKAAMAAALSVAVLVGAGGIAAAQTEPVEPTPIQVEADGAEGERGDRRGNRRAKAHALAAETIGITVDELREEFQAGSSVAEVAEANGVEPQAVIDALVGAVEERLDLAVENGRLTEEEAADKLAQKSERIADRVNGVPGEGRPGANG